MFRLLIFRRRCAQETIRRGVHARVYRDNNNTGTLYIRLPAAHVFLHYLSAEFSRYYRNRMSRGFTIKRRNIIAWWAGHCLGSRGE